MITSKHISELLNFKTPLSSVVSLYLDVSPDQDHRRALSRLMQSAQADPALAQNAEDLELIKRFVESEFEPERWRGLAVFSSKRFGLWRACPLPETVKTLLRVERSCYLPPLFAMTDQRHRFGVALARDGAARFLEVFMGQIKEYEEFAIAAKDFASEHDYLKSVSDRLDGLARNQGFQRVVLGASSTLSPKLVNHLHSSVQHNLILDENLGPDHGTDAVLERILACEAQARQVRETVLAHRLIDAAKTSARLAVLGLERTLGALQKGQVRLLLARDGYAKLGRRCPECSTLSINWTKCPDCGLPTETVFDLVGEMIARALEARCEVVRLLHDTPLDNVGRIGAELTCSPTEGASSSLARAREEKAAAR